MSPFLKNKNGFTFIELILYMALVGMMMSYLTPLAWNMILGSKKVVTQQELSTQARFVSERIKREIRNANGINSVTATSISLISADLAKNPTIIDHSSGYVRITWGSSTPVNLNSVDTIVPTFTFTNYSTTASATSKHIGFEFTMDTNYNSERHEYYQSVTMRSSAEIRSN